MQTSGVILLLWAAAGLIGNVCTASERDFLLPLRDAQVDVHANDVRFPANSAGLTTRVLLAGDSWARYMWTDGSHNDIFDRYGRGDLRTLSAARAARDSTHLCGTLAMTRAVRWQAVCTTCAFRHLQVRNH